MQKIKELFQRLSLESIIAVSLVTVLVLGLYSSLSNPVQLLILKATFISVGILHAHIMGKLIIPAKVDWNYKLVNQKGAFYARVSLYIIIPICYAMGG